MRIVPLKLIEKNTETLNALVLEAAKNFVNLEAFFLKVSNL